MKRVSLWFGVLAVVCLLSVPVSAIEDQQQEPACTLEVCPMTGMMMLKCPETGRTFYAAPAVVKLMIKSVDSGEMEACTFEGKEIFLCTHSGKLFNMTDSGEPVSCKADGKPLFLCPKTGFIMTKDPLTGKQVQCEKDGKMLRICPKSGKCMLFEAKELKKWPRYKHPETT